MLAVDIESSRVTRRYALPDPVQAPDVVDPDGSRTMSLEDSRQVVAVVPGGLLLQHRSGAEPTPARQLELLDTTTGELQPRTKLPAGVGLLAVRG
ncbi:hypothetical protein [Phytohabitans houttuyneae]|uniref:REJ domain-containing protein n=1 Tax=Phytohabitans houttuyneae TaxID=1076126 RepID=A0A6V8K838_9ACTN|nr:hypothetical protein [Phytohabitans houttuyneae]GFJ77897.1 hypothetical protein Phou_020770 [Phytohabitans houttuyneae]